MARQFSRLRTKLALAYMGVTLATLVILAACIGTATLWLFATQYASPADTVASSRPYLPLVGAYMAKLGTGPRTDLQATLDAVRIAHEKDASPDVEMSLALALTDPAGRVVAASPADSFRLDRSIDDQLSVDDRKLLNAVRSPLDATPSPHALVRIPVTDGKGANQGWLYADIHARLRPGFWLSFARSIAPLAAAVLLLGAICAVVLGAWVGGRLERRLDALYRAAESWRAGDLIQEAPAQPRDELGILGERLNGMARDLQGVMQERERLAVVAEREQMVRELHDTVKQQAFAASLQLASAQKRLPPDADGIECVQNAYRLIEAARSDLAGMLVMPTEDDSTEPLAPFIAERALRWQEHAEVALDLDLGEGLVSSGFARHQLLRILDEALANVLRHSRAQLVRVTLQSREQRFWLTIQDDGVGFAAEGRPSGMGIRNMESRSRSLPEGRFEIMSEPGTGVQILVSWRASKG